MPPVGDDNISEDAPEVEAPERDVPEQALGAPGRVHVAAQLRRHRLRRALQGFYRRHERPMLVAFFLGGVAWDAATLTRVDALFDNIYLLSCLLLLGGLILAAVLVEHERVERDLLLRFSDWYVPAIQFLLGALFSAYIVYYSQSTSLTPTAVFLVLLVALLLFNEWVHRRLFSLYLLVGLYFLVCFAFFSFFLPVVTGAMSYGIFVAGGVLGMAVVGGMISYLNRRGVFEAARQCWGALGLVVLLFGLMNLFYAMNWIPPVPLALRQGGVYHDVSRAGGAFVLRYEEPAWYAVWREAAPRFHRVDGAPVYCFAAVFAPTDLTEQIYHAWSFYDDEQNRWVQTDRIGYEVVGGRSGGYRGYTLKYNVKPGRWRVDVETASGRLIGRIRFQIVPTETPPKLAQSRYE